MYYDKERKRNVYEKGDLVEYLRYYTDHKKEPKPNKTFAIVIENNLKYKMLDQDPNKNSNPYDFYKIYLQDEMVEIEVNGLTLYQPGSLSGNT